MRFRRTSAFVEICDADAVPRKATTTCDGSRARRATIPRVSSCASRVTFTMPHSKSLVPSPYVASETSASHRAVSTTKAGRACGRRRLRRLSSRSSRTTSRLVSRSLFCGGGRFT